MEMEEDVMGQYYDPTRNHRLCDAKRDRRVDPQTGFGNGEEKMDWDFLEETI